MAEGGPEDITWEPTTDNTDIANREDEQLVNDVIDDSQGGYENPVYEYYEREEEPKVREISVEQELLNNKIDDFYEFIKTGYEIEPKFIKREIFWRDTNGRLYYIREFENNKGKLISQKIYLTKEFKPNEFYDLSTIANRKGLGIAL